MMIYFGAPILYVYFIIGGYGVLDAMVLMI